MPRRTLAVLVTATALATGAQAQNSFVIEDILMACANGLSVADVNRDGWVTPDEAESAIEANFALLDGDADGEVTRSEFLACRAGHMTETRRSATLFPNHVFLLADTDGDERLSRDQWLAQAMAQLSKTSFEGAGANPVTYDAMMQGFSIDAAQLDANGDGLIQLEEASAGIMPALELADANHDGWVTVTEHVTRKVTADRITPSDEEIALELGGVWSAMDADGSGGVSFEEYRAQALVHYERAAEAALSDPDVGVSVEALGVTR